MTSRFVVGICNAQSVVGFIDQTGSVPFAGLIQIAVNGTIESFLSLLNFILCEAAFINLNIWIPYPIQEKILKSPNEDEHPM